MTSPASAISGGYSQAEAQNEASLPHVRTGLAARVLNGKVETGPLAGEGCAEADRVRRLRHLVAVEGKWQGAESGPRAQSDKSLHNARTGCFYTDSGVPAVECLGIARRKRGERAPAIMGNARGNAGTRNSIVRDGGG